MAGRLMATNDPLLANDPNDIINTVPSNDNQPVMAMCNVWPAKVMALMPTWQWQYVYANNPNRYYWWRINNNLNVT